MLNDEQIADMNRYESELDKMKKQANRTRDRTAEEINAQVDETEGHIISHDVAIGQLKTRVQRLEYAVREILRALPTSDLPVETASAINSARLELGIDHDPRD